MAYRVILSPDAQQTLESLPEWLFRRVAKRLERLGKSPTRLSRRSVSPPYPPGYQMMDFRVRGTRFLHHFVVLFKYRTNETELFVFGIGHQKITLE